MIWLTWRQHRKQALFTLAGLAVLAALMVPTGLAMHNAYDDKGLPGCVRALAGGGLTPDRRETCTTAFHQFDNQFGSWAAVGILFLVLPLLVGLFWGAPLVAREVEQGTHRLVWTQSVSRRHWALVKIGFVGAATLAMSALYGLGMSWWVSPLVGWDRQSRFDAFFFDMQGVAPIGYTLFAVALGVFAGAVWQKMLPAMAVALTGFVGLRAVVATLVRPHYLPPRVLTYPVQGNTGREPGAHGDWILSSSVRDASGKVVLDNGSVICPPDVPGPGGRPCGADLGLGPGAYNWQQYQPGDRYWLFQWIETGVFVALAALLLYLAVRRIRRIA